jgi:hypothetical protein
MGCKAGVRDSITIDDLTKITQELVHPIEDAMGFYIDVVECYAKKLRPDQRFEISNAARQLKQLRSYMLQIVNRLIESADQIKTSQCRRINQEKQLALISGKLETLALIAEFVEQQNTIISLLNEPEAVSESSIKTKKRKKY